MRPTRLSCVRKPAPIILERIGAGPLAQLCVSTGKSAKFQASGIRAENAENTSFDRFA